jgi:hypothetical protein
MSCKDMTKKDADVKRASPKGLRLRKFQTGCTREHNMTQKIPNPKHQITNNLQIAKLKSETNGQNA